MNTFDLIDTMLTGRERYAEAVLEHTLLGIDRILNGSSKGPQQPMPGNPALVERPSPTDDAGTAGVVDLLKRKQAEIQRLNGLVDYYRSKDGEYERTLRKAKALLDKDDLDEARDVVGDHLRGIDGPND